jgi:transposase
MYFARISELRGGDMQELSKQFKVVKELIYGGIDLHKTFSVIFFIDKNGKRVASKRVCNNFDHYRSFFKPLLKRYRIRIAVEAGNITFYFCKFLHSLGIETYVVNVTLNKAISSSCKKTDKRDAKSLAIQLSTEHLPDKVYEPSIAEMELRSLVQHRRQLVKDRTRISNRAYALLSRFGIFVSKKILRDNDKYWKRIWLDELTDRESTLSFEFKMYMMQFCLLTRQLKEIEKKIKQKALELAPDEFDLLISIPGIGETIAAAIIAYCHDILRFSNGRKLAAYIGIAPKVKQSGDKKKTYSGPITKMGVSLLRAYFTQAVLALFKSKAQGAEELKQWYQKVKMRKGWQKARIAMARKIAHIAYGTLKRKKKFDPQLILKRVA